MSTSMLTQSAPVITDHSVRGALKVEVSTSEPIVTASGDFSIFVVIRNPFEVPITIYSVQTHIPIELVDSIWIQKLRISQETLRTQRIANSKGITRAWAYIYNWLESTNESFKRPESPRIAEAVGTDVEKDLSTASIAPINQQIIASEGGMVTESAQIGPFGELWKLYFPQNPTNDELDRIFMKIQDYRFGKIPVILQPGNSVVKQFVLRTKHWLFFTPISYKFQIQIKYAVDNKENLDTIPFDLQIRASLNATIIGAVLGSTLGSVAHSFGSTGSTVSGEAIILAMIFGAVAVVAFARKSNAQQFISVEDFWGGVLIGFLAGYIGENFFKGIIGIQ